MIQSAVRTFAGSEAPKKDDMIRMAAGMIVWIGADMALSALLGAHIPLGSGWKKMLKKLGIFILAMKVGEDAENYFNKVYDETRDVLMEAKKEMEKPGPVPGEGTVE